MLIEVTENNISKYKNIKGIYAHINHINENIKEVYVGKAQNLMQRLKQYEEGCYHNNLDLKNLLEQSSTKTYVVFITDKTTTDFDMRIYEDLYKCEFEAYGYNIININSTMGAEQKKLIEGNLDYKTFLIMKKKAKNSRFISKNNNMYLFEKMLVNEILKINIYNKNTEQEYIDILRAVGVVKNDIKFKNIDFNVKLMCDYAIDERYHIDRFYRDIELRKYQY